MLPSSGGQQQTGTSGGRRRQGGFNWIQNEMLSTTPRPAKILGVKPNANGKFGATVILKLALDGQTTYWSVNVKKDPNYPILEKEFGLDENNWVSKPILIHLEQDEFSEQYYKRVSFPPKQRGK